jgi:two-component system sensor histidine kinase RpfC
VPAPAPPVVLAVPRAAEVARFDVLSAGFAAVLELPFDKRLLFNVLHAVTAAEVESGAREGVIRLQDYAQTHAPQGAAPRVLNVLVADDNATNREVLGRILERAGHKTTLVAGGEAAMDALEASRYDIVLLDRNMPDMGGLEVVKALRAMYPAEMRIPTLIVSADVTPEAREECLEAGADGYLGKPVEAARLLGEVQRVAGAAQASEPSPMPRAQAPRVSADGMIAVVNVETLGHLEELGSTPGFIEKLVGVFIADNATLVAKMETAVSAHAFQDFRSLLHALKGSSASMGTDRLTRLCTSLGALNDGEMRLQAPALMRSLTQELGAARGELERYIAERRRSTG